jgi:hypothetical protein
METPSYTNSGRDCPVKAPGAWCLKGILLALGLAFMGCVEVEGGAVEFSWTLRNFQGNPIADNLAESCSKVGIDKILLIWEPPPDSGERVLGNWSFDCEANRGVTGFVVPEGPQLLRIVPFCQGGVLPRAHTYEVPPPILRDVRDGEVVTLNSLLVVVQDCSGQGTDTGCTCAASSTVVGN